MDATMLVEIFENFLFWKLITKLIKITKVVKLSEFLWLQKLTAGFSSLSNNEIDCILSVSIFTGIYKSFTDKNALII